MQLSRDAIQRMIGGVNLMGGSSIAGGGGTGGATALYECTDVARDGNKVLGAADNRVLKYGADGKWYGGQVGFGEVTGQATAGQVPNIEALTNFSTRVYDAAANRTANTVLAGPTSGNAAAATFRALVAADIPSLAISKISGLQTALDSKLDIAFFSSMFKAYAGTTEVAPNSGDTTTIDNIKAMFGFWTEQYLSARGRGAGGGGGGGTGNVTWDELASTAATGRKVDISYLADAISTLTGYTASGRNYAVEVNASNQLYVNVPWTDTDHYDWDDITNKPTAEGGSSSPVYWTGSAFTACDKPVSGAWFKGVVTVATDGVTEIGRYLDFHPTDGSTLDFNVRLDAGTGTTERTFNFPSVAGTLLSSGNSSVSLSNDSQTLTVKINGTEKSLTNTNTWRPLGIGATDACAGNDSRLSDARPASDVYSWAKQSTKPSYNLDEVSDGTTRKLANYLPLTGGSLSGALALAAGQYNGYKTGDARSYGLNANNSDIVGINALITADLSDGWNESIGFARTNGHYDTFRAADGVFYFGFNGYFDSDNVEHVASEIIQLKSTGSIECVRADTSDSRILVSNSSGNSVILLASTNRGLYLENKGWIVASDGTNCWSAFGNFGIGTNSPQYKLHVAGDIVATGCLTGRVTSASDIHAKNISSTVLPLSLVEIANAPTIRFKWKQGDDQADHVGSIAQYWQSVMPEVIWKNKEGMLTLEYGTAALISSITIAREVAALKQRIKELERKLKN